MTELSSAPLPALHGEDHVRGEGAALIVYVDFTCPQCAVLHAGLAGRAVAYRHFALRARNPRAVALAQASEAAALQGAFWAFADSLLADQGHQDDPHLWLRVEQLGLDLAQFERDRREEQVVAKVKEQVRAGMRGGVVATPALVVAGELRQGIAPAGLLAGLTG